LQELSRKKKALLKIKKLREKRKKKALAVDAVETCLGGKSRIHLSQKWGFSFLRLRPARGEVEKNLSEKEGTLLEMLGKKGGKTLLLESMLNCLRREEKVSAGKGRRGEGEPVGGKGGKKPRLLLFGQVAGKSKTSLRDLKRGGKGDCRKNRAAWAGISGTKKMGSIYVGGKKDVRVEINLRGGSFTRSATIIKTQGFVAKRERVLGGGLLLPCPRGKVKKNGGGFLDSGGGENLDNRGGEKREEGSSLGS